MAANAATFDSVRIQLEVHDMATLELGSLACQCRRFDHAPKLVVLTGGPGGGKTAVLDLARRALCSHVAILPEAASIVFGGGFPRRATPVGLRAAQRAIFCVQREIEEVVIGEREVAIGLCDRGTIDGLAYWPGTSEEYWRAVGADPERTLARYAAVIHLRTPSVGYNHDNALRIESAEEAARIDARILEVWSAHPRRIVVESAADFVDKAARALEAVRAELPPCCQHHPLPGVREKPHGSPS